MALFPLFILCLGVDGVFGDEVKTVMEGDSVTLNSDVPKQQHDMMRWYFNDTRIALINGDPSKSCLYDGEGGIFRDRLEVNYETGSLTITNIRSEHTGYYELEFIRKTSEGKSTSLNRTSKCDRTKITSKPSRADKDFIKSFRLIVTDPDKTSKDFNKNEIDVESATSSGLSAGVTAGIVVGVLLVFVVVAVGVIYYHRWRSSKERERNRELL